MVDAWLRQRWVLLVRCWGDVGIFFLRIWKVREVVHCFFASHFGGEMLFQLEYLAGSLCWVDFRLNMATRLAFSADEVNKTRIDNMLFNLFIKNEWHVIYIKVVMYSTREMERRRIPEQEWKKLRLSVRV